MNKYMARTADKIIAERLESIGAIWDLNGAVRRQQESICQKV